MTSTLETSIHEGHRKDLAKLLDAYPLPELAGKRIFLTGATGFVGYWLLTAVDVLNGGGANINIHALSRDPEPFLQRNPNFSSRAWLQWTQGDVRSYTAPEGGFDAFIHGATDTSPTAAEAPNVLYDTIVNGSHRVLDHALSSGAKRVLLLSSGAVYGDQSKASKAPRAKLPTKRDSIDPHQAYGDGKLAMENMSFAYGRTHNISVVSARGFSFIGYGLRRHLAIAQFINDAQENSFIAVKGDGQPIRSFLYAADMAIWLFALLARGKSNFAYDVGSPHGVSLAQAARLVRDALSPSKEVVIAGTIVAEPRRFYLPDARPAMENFGLRAWTTLGDAIYKTAHPTHDSH